MLPSGIDNNLSDTVGPGRFHAVSVFSNAVDAATDLHCTNARSGNVLTHDQAGASRPSGGIDCDIGADEP